MPENKPGIYITPNIPVVSIILAALSFLGKIYFGNFAPYNCVFLLSALLMLAGMILHRKNMQLLTGIGALIFALNSTYLLIDVDLSFIYFYGAPALIDLFDAFTETLAIAAFTVAGLHYTLRKPKPGKAPKLLLMIPLSCLWLIRALVHIQGITGIYPVKIMIFYLSHCLMAFALMVYTPFRKA